MLGMLAMESGRRTGIVLGVLALALTLAMSVGARAGEATKPSKVLCLVRITDTDGLPLASMGLIAFEDGVYRLRTEAGREIEIAEKEVSSAAFMPAGKPRHDKPRADKREPREAERRRGPPERPWVDGGWRPRGPKGRDDALARHVKEEREKLIRLKRSGALGREIEALKKRLRDVPTGLEAAGLIRKIVAARTVEDGFQPSEQDVRTLIESIGKTEVRERMKHVPVKYLLQQFGGPRGPRR
ncbi:MAG: hypothetical protein ACYTKD_11760 [Planctomycetota bacterium]|jgi:hypothetical protein